ncbi:MAG: PKD domain-containing protein [Bacteroidia bacterium]|nr:PKD domain-containing protein [Bacteroidia bacterium]
MKIKSCILFLFFLVFSVKSFATHIVGGEIFYDFLGGNNYRITLKLYRDCFTGLAPYDNPATIFIFDNSGNFIDSVEIPFPGSTVLPVSVNNPCFIPPTNICVEEAIYITNVNLPPLPGGYNITYQRCCRNNSILNLINPGDVGSTYMAHIPDPASGVNNSSPHYVNFPPIFLCLGVPLSFNHAATDPDGDSLYYELCDPFTGLSSTCPILGSQASGGCPMVASPPPYPFVPWLGSYNAAYPLSASPGLNINPQNGFMTGTPNMLGQWVVGVCVSEYRNGVFMDANKRDFQFNVVDCPNLPVASIPQQTQFCFGYNVNFTQNSVNAFNYHWDFGDPSTNLDTSNLVSPTWTYADSGIYTVTLIINPGTLCADTQANTFYIYPLLAPAFTAPPGECVYNNSFDFAGAGAYMGNGTLGWNFGSAASPSASSQLNPANVVFDSEGVFPVIFTISENGCTKSFIDSVHVYPKPVALFNSSTILGCVLNPVQFTDSSVSASPLTYYWNFGNGTSSILQNPLISYSSAGNYPVSLTITSEYGCKDTAVLPTPITVNPTPIAGFTLNPTIVTISDPYITMSDQSSLASDCEVFWGDGSSSINCDSMHKYTTIGKYTVMQVVENLSGCYDTAYSDITIQAEFFFWIPNAFTPNKNELNEIFKPNVMGVHDYSYLIFDRWGTKIFETTNTEEGWNGHYKNKLCKSDVYVYKITFEDDVENVFHQYIGKVTLVR